MRAHPFACSSLVSLALAIFMVGCGSQPKQVGDPSENNGESTNKSSEETPKWEGATPPPPPEAKPSGGGASVTEAPRRRTDQYDKEETEIVIKRAARQVKANCGATKGDDGKATGPWGKVTVQIELGSNGHSKGITVPSPYQGRPVGNCIEKAFTNLTFPPWGGSDTEVSWEVELVNPDAAATPPAK